MDSDMPELQSERQSSEFFLSELSIVPETPPFGIEEETRGSQQAFLERNAASGAYNNDADSSRAHNLASSDHSSDSASNLANIDMHALQHAWGAWGAHNGGLFGQAFTGGMLTSSKSVGVVGSLIQQNAHASTGGIHTMLTRSATTSSAPVVQKLDINGVASVIHDAARITDWNTVLELCETHPEYASYAGRDGWTALHHACNRRCPYPEVAEALIKAYPRALLQEEDKGWLPLHYACRFKAPKSVVRLLLSSIPEFGKAAVARRDRLGRTPLYYAIRYDAPSGVVGLLLEVDPSAVLEEDQNDESPLALVWDTWAEKLEGKRIIQNFLPGGFPEPEDTSVEQRAILLHKRMQSEPKLRKRWHKVNMLLKATFGFPVEDDSDDDDQSHESSQDSSIQRVWRIVHATAAVKCHISLFLLACALHPEQAREYDENDLRRPGDVVPAGHDTNAGRQTALHLAASSNAEGEAGKTVLITLLSLNPEAPEIQDGINGSLPLHLMVENTRKLDWRNNAGILYRFYPRAVQIQDHKGRLPLHRAAAKIQHVEGATNDEERSVIIQLVRAHPQAMFQTDKAGCLPFHYVAASAQIWDDDIESLHGVNRNAAQARAGPEFFNRLPIHLAAANRNAQESLIQRLIQLHPRGASIFDSAGKLPLHLLCENGKDWEVGGVRSVYDAFPNAIRQPENNVRGWLPLHMAAAFPESDVTLFVKLLEHYQDAAFVADADGYFALHLACGAGKSWKGGLEVLFDANASALGALDKWQRLPFHIAALLYCKQGESNANSISIKPLPTAEALKEKTAKCKDAAELDILYHLLRADPTTVSTFN